MSHSENTVEVAFVWHMHQPDYRNHDTRSILLPWVRLHALKDYYDMPARLRKYQQVKQTFNLVPSLIEQIECHLSDEWSDEELNLFRIPAEQLSNDQKHLILQQFFMAPEEHMIQPYPRYRALLRESRLTCADDLLQR